jgi:phage tail-like protein
MTNEVLEDLRFSVEWGGQSISMMRVSSLSRSYAVVAFRDGAQTLTLQHLQPGLQAFAPFLLERRVKAKDLDFQVWMDQVKASPDFRRDLSINVLDAQLVPIISFRVKGCWPSDYEAFAELNANDSGLLVERLTIQNEGWIRADS